MKPVQLAVLLLILPSACVEEPEIGTSEAEVQGTTSYGPSCTTADIALLERAMHFGRVASQSNAFAQCLADRMPGYIACTDDPAAFRSGTVSQRVTWALDTARLDNPIVAQCTGAAADAAAQTDFENVAAGVAEDYQWNRTHLTSLVDQVPLRPCGRNELPGAGCRIRNSPWSTAAKTIWHESTHDHGFSHDASANECQAGSGPAVVEQSVPELVGVCLRDVLWVSGLECGDQAACGTAGLSLVHQLGSTTCECVEDPGPGCWDNTDSDGDQVGDDCDACPALANQSPVDTDNDGTPEVCDNCPGLSNAVQTDADGDHRGNSCDNCPWAANADQVDGDADTVGNACDNCPSTWNKWQDNRDKDLYGDACDTDRDGDGLGNIIDLCPDLASLNNNDSDGDGLGDPCDGCDYVRGLSYDCKPLSQLMRLWLDDRLDAIAEEFRDGKVPGPWGPWPPFTQCMWKCGDDPVAHAKRREAAYTWRKANPGKAATEATMRSLLMGEEGATKAAVDRFLVDRLGPL